MRQLFQPSPTWQQSRWTDVSPGISSANAFCTLDLALLSDMGDKVITGAIGVSRDCAPPAVVN